MPKRTLTTIFGLFLLAFNLLLFSFIGPAHAQATRTEFFLAGRTATFTASPGPREIAVLFDPRVAGSQREADAIKNEFGDALQVGSESIVITYVDWTSAKPPLRDGSAIFFTRGMEAAWGMIADLTADTAVPTISAELDCVRLGLCVVGIQARPRVQIFVSRTAAQRARAGFTTAFEIMASEV